MNGKETTILFFQMGAYEEAAEPYVKALESISGIKVEKVRALSEQPVRSLFEYQGIVIGGSASLVTDRHPWSVRVGEYLKEVVNSPAKSKPLILGICYGHQLLADILGGQVEYMDKRYMGTFDVQLAEACADDSLLSVLDRSGPLSFQYMHWQRVGRAPPGSVVLATRTEPVDHHTAVRFAPNCWGVQFHPEQRPSVMRTFLEERRARGELAKPGDPPVCLAPIRDSPAGFVILTQFCQLCLEADKNRPAQ